MSRTALAIPPPLRQGDRLNSAEFIRRWEAMPDLKRAELLGGVVHMPSPVSNAHSDIQSVANAWLAFYAARTPGCRTGLEGTWIMGEDDTPQPDATLRILPERGGQSRVVGLYAQGAPELALEVAWSSQNRDLRRKTPLYEKAGVQEYITILVGQKKIIWRVRIGGKFEIVQPAGGLYRSRVFPGLWLDPSALFDLDLAALHTAVEKGTSTAGHASFAARLATPS
ncbi:MAG: Uma2 family endonuclease [Acidobacteria bacterium]|nr:Uma2 family endonuclease [Acidobacteriota bacterium]